MARTCDIHMVGMISALYTLGYQTSKSGDPAAPVEVEI